MNRWDERFSQPGWMYGTEPNDFLREIAPRLPKGCALFLGEGEGRNATFLAAQGWDVTAVDMSSVGLEKAVSLARERGTSIATVVADLNDYEIEENAWDVIVLIWIHLPPELRERVHAAAAKGLRSGGMVVVEAYTPDQLEYGTGGPPMRENLFTADMLRKDFAPLEPVICEETVRDVVEGRGHTGIGAVVRFLAVRG